MTGYGMPSVMPNADGCSPRMVAPPPPARGTREHPTSTRRVPWTELALCRGQTVDNTSIWIYPQNHHDHEVTEALRTCARCPVRAECDRYAPAPRVGIVAGQVWITFRGKAVQKELRPCRKCGFLFYSSSTGKTCSWECAQTCARGHLLTESNVYTDNRGYRVCRICKRARRGGQSWI